jgi:predicted RNA methylase
MQSRKKHESSQTPVCTPNHGAHHKQSHLDFEEPKIFQQLNIEELLERLSQEDIEQGLVCLFLRANALKTRNQLILKIINSTSAKVVEDVKDYLTKKKIVLDFVAFQKFFEVLVSREDRKDSGSFFTPLFVVDYITEKTILGDDSVIDPTCGCGAFLLGAVNRLRNVTHKPVISIIEQNLYGADISKNSIRRAKIVLTLFALINGEDKKEICFNFVVGDSLTIEWEKTFPTIFKKGGFDAVIGNPPYAEISAGADVKLLQKQYSLMRTKNANPNLYLLFLELMPRLTKGKTGRCGIIIPLSIAYNSGKTYEQFRKMIMESTADWQFGFYDRSPDSLFGDKVKTRNSIVFVQKTGNYTLHTTKLHRWHSKNRDTLFDNVEYQNITHIDITKGIPKISSAIELQALKSLGERKERLSDAIDPLFRTMNKKQRDATIFFHNTAYNWLPFFRELPISKDANGKLLGTEEKNMLLCNDDNHANLIYAVLNSRLSYWYWLVYGDGFHMNRTFIESLPINPSNLPKKVQMRIATLGAALKNEVKKHPTTKNNSGKAIGNFNILACGNIIDSIDTLLLDACQLPKEFLNKLYSRYSYHISAGRHTFKNSTNLKIVQDTGCHDEAKAEI